MSKPNCYDCKYRGGLAGDAHSRCLHPKAGIEDNPMGELLAMLAHGSRIPTTVGALELRIVGSDHGRRNGWFNWPFNFDPVWLENCDGFESKHDNSEGGDSIG